MQECNRVKNIIFYELESKRLCFYLENYKTLSIIHDIETKIKN